MSRDILPPGVSAVCHSSSGMITPRRAGMGKAPRLKHAHPLRKPQSIGAVKDIASPIRILYRHAESENTELAPADAPQRALLAERDADHAGDAFGCRAQTGSGIARG